MTKEKIDAFAKFLEENKDTAQRLFESTDEAALAVLNNAGNEFTLDDIHEIGVAFEKAASRPDGELNESEMDSVAGGVLVETALIALALSSAGLGYKIGSDLAKKYGW